jgi:hypothetical protein
MIIPGIVWQVAAAVLLLAVVAWRLDPPLRSNLIAGSVTAWQRSDNPSPPSPNPRTWLFVKMDDGRIVGVASKREGPQPTEGERVLVQERIGLFGTRKLYEMPN